MTWLGVWSRCNPTPLVGAGLLAIKTSRVNQTIRVIVNDHRQQAGSYRVTYLSVGADLLQLKGERQRRADNLPLCQA
jgi:hypothetical protein